jgi:hypothetical protein
VAATRPALLARARPVGQVPTFAVTDDKGKPYVAEFEGKNKGFFFLDPADALSFAERVKQLQQAGAPVVVRPTTLDNAIKYVKTSQNNADPFEIVPISEQVRRADWGRRCADACMMKRPARLARRSLDARGRTLRDPVA